MGFESFTIDRIERKKDVVPNEDEKIVARPKACHNKSQ